MSKFLDIRNVLTARASIVILNPKDYEKHDPFKYTGTDPLSIAIEFMVAPKRAIYTVDELNSFMTDLLPGLEPNEKNNFRIGEESLWYGNLVFNEVIGTHEGESIVLSLPQEELPPIGMENHLGGSAKYIRTINVNPYPSEDLAMRAYNACGRFSPDVSLEKIKDLQDKLFQSLARERIKSPAAGVYLDASDLATEIAYHPHYRGAKDLRESENLSMRLKTLLDVPYFEGCSTLPKIREAEENIREAQRDYGAIGSGSVFDYFTREGRRKSMIREAELGGTASRLRIEAEKVLGPLRSLGNEYRVLHQAQHE